MRPEERLFARNIYRRGGAVSFARAAAGKFFHMECSFRLTNSLCLRADCRDCGVGNSSTLQWLPAIIALRGGSCSPSNEEKHALPGAFITASANFLRSSA